ncbi:MAG TPA: hypothetical protein PLL75_05595 [Candidatus Omnitrophota bacterium]|nr:hypothetical protein [Candidatus Omnitrophota bacterium]HPS37181.1 hypothetical protein [Candidatus Omnitrophota bacterium]
MKNLFLTVLSIFVALFLVVGVILFVPTQGLFEKGPKVQYRVEEGVVDVFSARNGQIQGFLGAVKPGETLTAPTLSRAAQKVPFWLSWIEPVVVDVVGRARYFMYKEGKKTKNQEFTVGYTNKTIRKGFIQELERTRLLKNIEMDFFPEGFSFYTRAIGISITARGTVSTLEGAGDALFLRLKWLKVGDFQMPEHVLRAVENLFIKAYTQSGNFSIRLLRISFSDGAMVMTFRKASKGSETDFGL